MKAIKYLFTAALLACFGTAAQAQDGTKADIDAVKKIISSKPADLDKQMKPYYKENRKNPEMLVAFGRAFYEAKDTANAKVYANHAISAAKKNPCAAAFLLLGDIEALADNGGGAASYYDQAIYADPKCQEAYYKYALVYRKIDPQGSAAKLDQLKQQCPDVEVDAIKGHIFYIANKLADSYDSYSKANLQKLNKGDLIEYASVCYFNGKHTEGLKVAEQGHKMSPRNATFNRLGMMFNVETKNYDAAVQYIDKLFNASDSLVPTNTEYYYAGLAYAGLKNYDKAIEAYQNAVNVQSDKNLINKNTIIKSISDTYMEKGDFENAIKYYQEYLANNDKKSFSDEEGLATLNTKYADSLQDATKKEAALMAADAVYADMYNKYETNKAYILYKRASIANKIDPNQEKGTAKVHYENLINLLAPKENKEASDKQILVTAYHYMMAYSLFTEKDTPKAKEVASKILEINPDYKPAQDILNLK